MRKLLLLLPWLSGCDSSTPLTHAPAAELSHSITEEEMPHVRLSPEALSRLRVETTVVREERLPHTRLVGGEVIVPPGRTITVTAPVAGEIHFTHVPPPTPGSSIEQGAPLMRLTAIAPADRDTRAQVAREVTAAQANVEALELRVARNRELVSQQAGSTRALEEAIAARDVARADLTAARSRATTLDRAPLLSDVTQPVRAPSSGVLRLLNVAEGQTVSAGTPLFELVAVDALQVRVPVYSGDLSRIDTSAEATIQRKQDTEALSARFILGPPTADPERSTVDRYLSLPAHSSLAPGERVLVHLPLRESTTTRLVPASSVLFDAWGGAWVYRCEGQHFFRARIDLIRRSGEDMLIAQGPAVDSCIVSVGAVELFGTEFPPGH